MSIENIEFYIHKVNWYRKFTTSLRIDIENLLENEGFICMTQTFYIGSRINQYKKCINFYTGWSINQYKKM